MEYVETDPEGLPELPTVSPEDYPELIEEAIADSGVDLDPDCPT